MTNRTVLWLRRLLILLVTGLLLVVFGALGLTWHYAGVIENDAFAVSRSRFEYNYLVTAVGPSTVTLRPAGGSLAHLKRDGVYGLGWPGGYAHVGQILQVDGDSVTRELSRVAALPPAGDRVRLDVYAYRGDPSAVGLPFSTVSIETPLGPAPAWLVPGSSDLWCIFVHGRRSTREEAIRMLPVTHALGLPSLVITYRNDEEAPLSEDRRWRWGETEWRDLEAALEYAQQQGARRFVLYGYSMGGSIVLSFLEQSSYASDVVGIILDAPVANFDATIDHHGRQGWVGHLPDLLTDVAQAIAAQRFDIDWGELNYLSRVKATQPLLLFHGAEDTQTPVAVSESLAERWPGDVTYIRVERARHIGAWNVDPEAYSEAVRRFLIDVGR